MPSPLPSRLAPANRRAAGVACGRLAARLYGHLRPQDGRLGPVLALLEPLLLGALPADAVARADLDAALQTACDCGVEEGSAAAAAADALAALCTAALAQHDGQPASLVELFASLACSHAAAALDVARGTLRDAAARAALDRTVEPLRPTFAAALAQWPVQPMSAWAPLPPFPPDDEGTPGV